MEVTSVRFTAFAFYHDTMYINANPKLHMSVIFREQLRFTSRSESMLITWR